MELPFGYNYDDVKMAKNEVRTFHLAETTCSSRLAHAVCNSDRLAQSVASMSPEVIHSHQCQVKCAQNEKCHTFGMDPNQPGPDKCVLNMKNDMSKRFLKYVDVEPASRPHVKKHPSMKPKKTSDTQECYAQCSTTPDCVGYGLMLKPNGNVKKCEYLSRSESYDLKKNVKTIRLLNLYGLENIEDLTKPLPENSSATCVDGVIRCGAGEDADDQGDMGGTQVVNVGDSQVSVTWDIEVTNAAPTSTVDLRKSTSIAPMKQKESDISAKMAADRKQEHSNIKSAPPRYVDEQTPVDIPRTALQTSRGAPPNNGPVDQPRPVDIPSTAPRTLPASPRKPERANSKQPSQKRINEEKRVQAERQRRELQQRDWQKLRNEIDELKSQEDGLDAGKLHQNLEHQISLKSKLQHLPPRPVDVSQMKVAQPKEELGVYKAREYVLTADKFTADSMSTISACVDMNQMCTDDKQCLKWGGHSYIGKFSAPDGVAVTLHSDDKCSPTTALPAQDYKDSSGNNAWPSHSWNPRVTSVRFEIEPGYALKPADRKAQSQAI